MKREGARRKDKRDVGVEELVGVGVKVKGCV